MDCKKTTDNGSQSLNQKYVSVNSELIRLYWNLGQQIVEKQENAQWGSGFIERLSKDLQMEFPNIGGFSYRNLRRCKQFYLFYNQCNTIRPQLVAKLEDDSLFQIPWGHHGLIMERIKVVQEALFYIHKTIENGWSRAILEYHIFVSLSTTFFNFFNFFIYPLFFCSHTAFLRCFYVYYASFLFYAFPRFLLSFVFNIPDNSFVDYQKCTFI